MLAECLIDPSYSLDEDDCPSEKARQLLQRVLPDDAWSQFASNDAIEFTGKRGTYLILAHAQTKIYHPVTGSCLGYGCLQLSIPTPDGDRMLAEYLLLKNDEDRYWQTANIFGPASSIAVFFFAFLDLWLLGCILHVFLS